MQTYRFEKLAHYFFFLSIISSTDPAMVYDETQIPRNKWKQSLKNMKLIIESQINLKPILSSIGSRMLCFYMSVFLFSLPEVKRLICEEEMTNPWAVLGCDTRGSIRVEKEKNTVQSWTCHFQNSWCRLQECVTITDSC